MKTNFKKSENTPLESNINIDSDSEKKDLTQEEYEQYAIKSGAKGSFMVYRSIEKDEELGLDEL
jgi:hypothetical protein